MTTCVLSINRGNSLRTSFNNLVFDWLVFPLRKEARTSDVRCFHLTISQASDKCYNLLVPVSQIGLQKFNQVNRFHITLGITLRLVNSSCLYKQSTTLLLRSWIIGLCVQASAVDMIQTMRGFEPSSQSLFGFIFSGVETDLKLSPSGSESEDDSGSSRSVMVMQFLVRHIFFFGLFIFILIFSHLWWFEGWGFGVGVLNWVFGVGVWGLWCGAFSFFWGWGSLYKHRRITLGIKIMRPSEFYEGQNDSK